LGNNRPIVTWKLDKIDKVSKTMSCRPNYLTQLQQRHKHDVGNGQLYSGPCMIGEQEGHDGQTN